MVLRAARLLIAAAVLAFPTPAFALKVSTTPFEAPGNRVALDVFVRGQVAEGGPLTVYASACARNLWCGRERHVTVVLHRGRVWRHATLWLTRRIPYMTFRAGCCPVERYGPALAVDGAQVVVARGREQLGPIRWFIPTEEAP